MNLTIRLKSKKTLFIEKSDYNQITTNRVPIRDFIGDTPALQCISMLVFILRAKDLQKCIHMPSSIIF